jgi:hypothetical protein
MWFFSPAGTATRKSDGSRRRQGARRVEERSRERARGSEMRKGELCPTTRVFIGNGNPVGDGKLRRSWSRRWHGHGRNGADERAAPGLKI